MQDNGSIEVLLMQARAHSQTGHWDSAAQAYERILTLAPQNPAVHFELGLVEFRRNDYRSAIIRLRQAVELDGTRPAFHQWLGVAYSTVGEFAAGAKCFERVLDLAPDNTDVRINLAASYHEQGRLSEAIDQCRKAIEQSPGSTRACLLLGRIFLRSGENASAIDVYRAAIAAGNDDIDIQASLAQAVYEAGQYAEAAALFKAVSDRNPEYRGAFSYLGSCLGHLGRFAEAVACHARAIEQEPGSAAPHYSLALTLTRNNDLIGAISSYRKALAIEPDRHRAHSNLLIALNYLQDISQQAIYEESRRFDAAHRSDSVQVHSPAGRSTDQDRRLRVGYVSPDFRAHSVALFTRNLFGAHDPDQVETFCYANVARNKRDRVTAEFRAQADHWEDIFAMSDQEAASRIREQQIDILVDLAGHTENNRLPLFAQQPAPIQVSWLGYPNTTGLACMHYRLTDAVADPPGVADSLHTEELVRLPHGFLCYQPEAPAPSIMEPPHVRQGYITFGSFNLASKITPGVVEVWSRILDRIPDSRLLLKSLAFDHDSVRAQFIDMFRQHGTAPERLELLGRIPNQDEHLQTYARIDIGLDPFPYNGTTTTCEALWMGVPVVSLIGDRHAGRVGASILEHVGLSGCIADSAQDYVDRACSLAGDTETLRRLRQQIRPQMQTSPLMDVRGFAGSLEHAYRKMWHAWCDGRR